MPMPGPKDTSPHISGHFAPLGSLEELQAFFTAEGLTSPQIPFQVSRFQLLKTLPGIEETSLVFRKQFC